ncbi:MAG: hypothetical protein LBS01_05730 [Prevotellaceae bacterium]|jgi:hypothetical protein|nr:hypothetical protein [Prevotellaceae bacterium]
MKLFRDFFRKRRLSQKLDAPVEFGLSTSWLAIPTEDTEKVIKALESLQFDHTQIFSKFAQSNWRTGCDAAYENDDLVFVTPPLHGWTFVVGNLIGNVFCGADENDVGWSTKYYRDLAKHFDNFYFFATHTFSIFEHHCWAFVKNGEIIRYFLCRDSELVYNYGEVTAEEIELSLNEVCYGRENDDNYDWDNPKYLAEEDVIALSEKYTTPHSHFENEPKSLSLGIVLKHG